MHQATTYLTKFLRYDWQMISLQYGLGITIYTFALDSSRNSEIMTEMVPNTGVETIQESLLTTTTMYTII